MSNEIESAAIEGVVTGDDVVNPDKVWAVSHGSYSDYSVLVICMTEREANELCEDMNKQRNSRYDDYYVEEFSVARGPQAPVQELYMSCRVGSYEGTGSLWSGDRTWNPNTLSEVETINWYYPFEQAVPPKCDYRRNEIVPGNLSFTVRGSDIERVRKVYSEKRAEILAQLEGLS